MGMERDHHGGQAFLARSLHQPVDEIAMALVHAIEHADGHGSIAPEGGPAELLLRQDPAVTHGEKPPPLAA